MKGTKLIQRRRGGEYLLVRNTFFRLLPLIGKAFSFVFIWLRWCIIHFPNRKKHMPSAIHSHTSCSPLCSLSLSGMALENFLIQHVVRVYAGSYARLLGFIYLFSQITDFLDLVQHYCRMVLKCWGRRSRGSVEVNEGSRVWRSFCFYHLTISTATQGNCSVTEGDEKSRAMDVFCERRNVDTKEMSSTGRNFALPFYL